MHVGTNANIPRVFIQRSIFNFKQTKCTGKIGIKYYDTRLVKKSDHKTGM